MPRKPAGAYDKAIVRSIVWMGDSLTDASTLGVPPERTAAGLLEAKLQDLGCLCEVKNFGRSGNDTGNTAANMLARFNWMLAFGVPDLAILFAGTNDVGTYSTAQTTANLQAMIKWLKFGCIGLVAAETNLPANAVPGSRYVVLADGSSTGGAAAATGQTATITGAGGSAQTVWEYRNGQAGVAGWGRIATASTAADTVSRIIVNSMHYLNYSTGGDTLITPYAPFDDITGVRKAQFDAVANESTNNPFVVYNDFYAFDKTRIVAGLDTQGDFKWHYADSNVHFNQYGNELLAQSLLAKIQAQDGAITALSRR